MEFPMRWETNSTDPNVESFHDNFMFTYTGPINECYGSQVSLVDTGAAQRVVEVERGTVSTLSRSDVNVTPSSCVSELETELVMIVTQTWEDWSNPVNPVNVTNTYEMKYYRDGDYTNMPWIFQSGGIGENATQNANVYVEVAW
jgi:hypothetical protein